MTLLLENHKRLLHTRLHTPPVSELRALLVGMEWLPNQSGGLNRYFYDLVHALPATGVAGVTLASDVRVGQTAPLELRSLTTRGTGLPDVWRDARRHVRRALSEDLDVVNAHFAPYALPWLRDIPRALPLVVHFHGAWADEIALEAGKRLRSQRMLFARWIERKVYQRADRVITLSQAFADTVHSDYGVERSKIRVVPGGVNMLPFACAPCREEARRRLGWPQSPTPILLSVRRLTPRMGLENLIRAFAALRSAHPSALLFIAGKGPLTATLQAQIEAANLTANVRLLGFVPDALLPLAYAAADATVVPTLALEGFGLVSLESLASGTPVLGTPVGGTPEVLRGLDANLLFADATPESLADRLDAVLSKRLSLPPAEVCRTYAARFAWSEIAPRVRSVFEESRQYLFSGTHAAVSTSETSNSDAVQDR